MKIMISAPLTKTTLKNRKHLKFMKINMGAHKYGQTNMDEQTISSWLFMTARSAPLPLQKALAFAQVLLPTEV